MMQFLLKTPPAIHIRLPLSFDSWLFSSLPLSSVISLSLLFFLSGERQEDWNFEDPETKLIWKAWYRLGLGLRPQFTNITAKIFGLFFSRKKKSVVSLKFVICSELQEHNLIMGQGWVRVREEWWIPSKGVGAGWVSDESSWLEEAGREKSGKPSLPLFFFLFNKFRNNTQY